MSDVNNLKPIQNPLTMVIPLKEGKTVDDLQQFMADILPDNLDALKEVGTIHYLRIMPLDNGRKVAFCSDYDGSFEKYCIDFAVTLGTSFFEPLLTEFAPATPPIPVAEHIPEFTQTIAYFDHQPLFYYSAYPETTVQDVWFQFGDQNQINEPVDLFGRDIILKPYDVYKTMRAEHPVYFSKALNSWMIFKFADVERVLEDKEIVLYSIVPGVTKELPASITTKMETISTFWSKWPTTLKPPTHTAVRTTQNAGFTEELTASFKGAVQTIADNLIDALQGKTEADIYNQFTVIFPLMVMTKAMGIPDEDFPKMLNWSMAITRFLSLGVITSANQSHVDGMYNTIQEMYAYFEPRIAAMHHSLIHDVVDQVTHHDSEHSILGHIVKASKASGAMTDRDIIDAIAVYIFGSHGTSMNFLTNGLIALLENPEQLAKLKSDPSLVNKASVELLRYAGPVQIGTRVSPVDITLSDGTKVPANDNMVLFYASANHDETSFDKPEVLDITREPKKNFAAGGGIHDCIGYPFITLMGEVALNTLLRRLPGLALNGTYKWRPNFGFRGVYGLPVKFDSVLPR